MGALILRLLFLGLLLSAAKPSIATPAVLANQVVHHPSPYLAMHGDDPVHWQVWSRETLQKARDLNRPILVSIGYFSCHWCHVMQRESYRDAELARRLNEAFIPVKVDRELDPALDAHLIDFVQITRGQAGWPLNVILTPEGYPVVGMTYVPRDRFYLILDQLQQRWQRDPSELRKLARNAMDEWQKLRQSRDTVKPARISAARNMLVQTRQLEDELAGGFGQQTKFPMVPQLRALLWIRAQKGDSSLDDFIRLTLDRMADQGLRDQLGGGFFRYVTDPAWQVPHFEKMLYDNAQLAVLYLEAADQYDSLFYRQIGLDTLDFMLREMRHEEGFFISSFSAVDEQGREGFYYLWDEETLQEHLSDDQFKAVKAAWFGESAAEAEEAKLPRWQGDRAGIAKRLGWSDSKFDEILSSARAEMLRLRSVRSLLPDDKGLAAWNGLVLSALAAGHAASKDAKYEEVARALAEYISEVLWDGERLLRARKGDRILAEATLEDYALVAQGLWDWSEQLPEDKVYAALAGRLASIAWRRYFKDDRWVQTDTPLIPMLDGNIALRDSPLPSASAAVTRLSLRIEALKKRPDIRRMVDAHLDRAGAYLGDSVFWYAGYVELLERNQPLP